MSVETAWREIEAEHTLLGEKLAEVVRLCPGRETRVNCHACPYAQPLECSYKLQDMVGDLLAYMVSHFRHEESLMRHWGVLASRKDMCDRHMEDHGDISEAFGALAVSLHGDNPLPRVRDIYSLLHAWLGPHIEEHDRPLLEHFSGR